MQAYHFTAMDCAMLKVILTHKYVAATSKAQMN